MQVLPRLEGAFSFGMLDSRQIIAVRDPHGFRPLCLGRFSYQQVCDIIREEFPELKEKVPEGTPGAPLPDTYDFTTELTRTVLGVEFRGLKETIVDTVKNLLELEKARRYGGRLASGSLRTRPFHLV